MQGKDSQGDPSAFSNAEQTDNREEYQDKGRKSPDRKREAHFAFKVGCSRGSGNYGSRSKVEKQQRSADKCKGLRRDI